LNIIRPANHVSVSPSLGIYLVLTLYPGTKLSPMAPFTSIMTALYALESPSLLTELSAAFPSILLTRTTNENATIHILD
jgi:hypothetical protein